MADRPLSAPLPADLPENWEDNQIVAPSGASVGLSEQHGYNYLMEMVNRAHEAVNTINESFDSISGKRTCRFVVGTSTAGWTQADCDFLCDGTDDQVEIQAAMDAASSGGEIVLLSGYYYVSDQITVEYKNVLRGNGAKNTRVTLQAGAFSNEMKCAVICAGQISDLELSTAGTDVGGRALVKLEGDAKIINVAIWGSDIFEANLLYEESAGSSGHVRVQGCQFRNSSKAAFLASGGFSCIFFADNQIYSGDIKIGGDGGLALRSMVICGNIIENSGEIAIENAKSGAGIFGNRAKKIKILGESVGVSAFGNNLNAASDQPCISLGSDTKFNFVTGNSCFYPGAGIQRPVEDLGFGNIVRFNSNDASGGGGGTAGVSSFKGRSGAVVPQIGDYTAAMVGAIPSGDVVAARAVTQAEYDALTQKDPATLYLITE